MKQPKKSNGNASGLIVGALVGAAVGAGVALLCAPRSGEETREMLADKARDLKDRTARALEQGKHAVGREANILTTGIKKATKSL